VIKFVSDLRHVGGFLHILLFPPPIKLTNTLSWMFVSASSLNQKSAVSDVAPLRHIILIPSKPALSLNSACLAEKEQIPFF